MPATRKTLSIRSKILAVIGVLSIITGLIAALGHYQLGQITNRTGAVIESEPATLALATVALDLRSASRDVYQAVAYDGASAKARAAAADVQVVLADAADNLAKAEQLDPTTAATAAQMKPEITALEGQLRSAADDGLAERNDEANSKMTAADRDVEDLSHRLSAIIAQRSAEAVTASTAARADASSAGTQLLVAAAIALALSMGGGLFVSHYGIAGPIAALGDDMKRLADGDDQVAVAAAGRGDEIGLMGRTVLVFRDMIRDKATAEAERARIAGEAKQFTDVLYSGLAKLADYDLTVRIDDAVPEQYEQLKQHFNGTAVALRDLVAKVIQSTGTLQTGSSEIAQASEDLARRTEGNAASLEETSAAVRQMDTRLKATAVAAEQSVSGSQKSTAAVEDGRLRTDEAVTAMGRVAASAKGIDDVIEGLDKIAFQTRVLAMNAAVEAGRAGDAGRGFAVVADLVSALAMRAEEEAKRARDQLTVTQSDIITAVDAVHKINGSLANIAQSGEEAAALTRQIAADNQAQATAVSQISSAMSAMDQSTQQNAAMVEQTSAAARNLSSEVAALDAQAGRFRIGTEPATRPSPAAPPQRPKASTPAVTQKLPKPAPRPMEVARSGTSPTGTGTPYVSPVKPLQDRLATAMTGNAAVAVDQDDWTAF